MTYLSISQIRVDGGTQSRVTLNQDKVREYAAILEDGGTLPDITVYYDQEYYWLADGYHRLNAHMLAFGIDGTIGVEVHQGNCRDAVLYSLSANSTHGLPRSTADKRVAALRLLKDPEWQNWADSVIGRYCGLTTQTVAKYRAEIEGIDQGTLFPDPSPRTVTHSPKYQTAPKVEPIEQGDDFVEWKIVKSQLIIQTAEDSVGLSFPQALTLLEFLQHKKDSLRGIK